MYLKDKNKENFSSINMEDSFKLSVNFDVSDWTKVANIYHIFIDSFNHSSEKMVEEIPKKKIHHLWEE